MPKDATKNVDRYKVRGGQLNEYDFEREKATDKKGINTTQKSKKSVPQKAAKKKPSK